MRVRALPPASAVGTADDQVVPGSLDLDVVLAATDDHGLLEHVLPDDRAVALDRLDARAQQLAQLAPQVAEVGPLLAPEEEGDLARVEGRLGLDQLDREVPAAHQLERRPVVLPLALEVLVLARQVARVGLLDDALERAGGGPHAGRDDHRAECGAALGFDQHAIVAREEERTRIEVVDPAARPEADADREGSGLYRLLFHGDASRPAPAPRSIARSERSMVSTASIRLAFFSRA